MPLQVASDTAAPSIVHDSHRTPCAAGCDDEPPPPQPTAATARPKTSASGARPRMVRLDPGHTFALMPTVFLILVALCDLRLSADVVGLRVQAKLSNDADEPVEVLVGDSCAGPLFKLVVDGKPRPFVGTGRACATPHLYSHTVPAHGEYAILSDALDGRHHRVQVRLGELVSPVLQMPTLVRVDVSLAATMHPRAGQPIDLELTHVNRSPEDVTVPSCGEDRLLVDGVESPLPAVDACVPSSRMLMVRGAFVTRGRLPPLSPGRHTLRARWRDAQSDDVIVDVGD